MTHRRLQNNLQGKLGVVVVLIFLSSAKIFGAETAVFHLRTGEKISGTIISENTNAVVVSNVWAKEISIPLAQIERRETNITANVAVAASPTNAPVATNLVSPAVAALSSLKTNTPPPIKPAQPRLWHGSVQLGMDLLYNTVHRQIYNARVKLTYAKPYPQHPEKFFRNSTDYLYEYGHTDGLLSANRMEGSDKIDFDVGRKIFIYNLVSAGYDEIRKIDLHYDFGPGVGYHLFVRTNFVMNTEVGANYQVQRRSVGADVENFYYRLAEDLTWRINPPAITTSMAAKLPITFTEKFEFFPRVESFEKYRARFETSFAFPLLQNLSFNISLIDIYDTQPALNVSKNEIQVRSTIGVTF